MKTRNALAAAALFAIAGVALAEEPEAPVAVNVEGLPRELRVRIEEKAKEGPSAVIRYLQRTYHLHHLRAEDIIKPAEASPPAAKQEDTRVSVRVDASKP